MAAVHARVSPRGPRHEAARASRSCRSAKRQALFGVRLTARGRLPCAHPTARRGEAGIAT